MKIIIGGIVLLIISWWSLKTYACETTTYVLDGKVYVCIDCGNNVITCN
jgi:hypothetical protein